MPEGCGGSKSAWRTQERKKEKTFLEKLKCSMLAFRYAAPSGLKSDMAVAAAPTLTLIILL